MKRIALLLFIALLALGSSGQTMQRRLALGVGAGIYDANRHLAGDDNNKRSSLYFTPEAYLSWCASNSFDVILAKMSMGFKPINGSTSTDFVNFGVANLRYKFANDKIFKLSSKIQPYLFAGPIFLNDNKQKNDDFGNKLGYDFGLGFKFPLSKITSLYLEGGYLDGVGNVSDNGGPHKYKDNLMKVTVGLEFNLTNNDWDNDGVKNSKDKCPRNTAEEISKGVDADGCPLDTDGDGVPDYRDKCPDTPKGCKVDEKGCPLDTDGDGIIDCQDDCPTAAGLKEFKGCPDTDGDGVPDKNDECPGTPKGCKVDSKGCPLDSDGDGIIDCEDKCPNEKGVKELQGCPIICVAIAVDPVYFDFDKAVLKPAGMEAIDAFITKLGNCKQYDIVVNGHTCSIGTKAYNQKLSEKRAQAVVQYLITKGVNSAYVAGKGFGETEPALPNTTRANREKNRRAIINMTVK
jgi:OmpA-OmpF porin, OOP family